MSCNGNCATCAEQSRLKDFKDFQNKYKAIENFEYNEQEYAHPSNVLLGVTSQCNSRCPYCFSTHKNEFMTLETAEKIVEWAIENGKIKNTIPNITFFGGEPLLQFDEIIVPIVEKYQDQNIEFNITTNGLLLDEDKVDFFYKHNITPLLSFDGVQQVQNSQRPAKNGDSFKQVINNIPYLLLRLPNTTMRCTMTKESIPYTLDSIKMAQELGFKKIVFCPNAYEDWDKEIEKQLEQEFKKIGLWIYKQLLNENPNIIPIQVDPICDYFSTLNLAVNNQLKFNNEVMRCGLGTTTCAFTPNGDIVPCQEKIANPTWIIGNIEKGIDIQKHQEFLQDYFTKVNNLSCNKDCSNREKLICLSNTCPSRLEDMNFQFSTAHCAFLRTALKTVARLHLLCDCSNNIKIREYFKQGDENLNDCQTN